MKALWALFFVFYKEVLMFQHLNADDCVHAVGQGAIAIECREDDPHILELVWQLGHRETMLACIAERAVMRTLVTPSTGFNQTWEKLIAQKLG